MYIFNNTLFLQKLSEDDRSLLSLSRRLGMSIDSLSRFVNNENVKMDYNILRKISDFYKMDINDFVIRKDA